MYTGIVGKTKAKLEKVAIERSDKMSVDDIMMLLVDSLDAIQMLEEDCKSQYSEGKADGMERMAEILCGRKTDTKEI